MELREKQNNMLQQITWHQFLVATLVMTLIWYAGVILIFYRKELKAFLSGNKIQKPELEPLPHRWDDDTLADEPEDDLIGKPVLPEGMSMSGMDEISFADHHKELQQGEIPDVLEELKSVFSILAKEDGDKSDFFSLMKLVKAKYPNISSNPNLESINTYIGDHVSFLITKEELDDLWD